MMFKKRTEKHLGLFIDVKDGEIPYPENEYLCINGISIRASERMAYTIGKTYYYESIGCITDNYGNTHQRIPENILKHHFKVRPRKK